MKTKTPKYPLYDASYIDAADGIYLADPRCTHSDTVLYDAEFPNWKQETGHPSRVRPVCTRCGRIGKWCPIRFGRFGAYWIARF